MASEQILEREFLDAATKRSHLLQSGEPRKANRQYDRIHRLKDKMRELPDRGEAALKRISKTDDPAVQMAAAAALLAVDEQFATELLERIAVSHRGLDSFTAEMTLKEWRRGVLREYWG
jgi:hypothetical protein